MSKGNGHVPEYRRLSEQQLNAEALARRDVPNRLLYERSQAAREKRAVDRPRTFGKLREWYQREWNAEFPNRMHERGVEPDSQLGAPRLAGAMRARFSALDDAKAASATDYDREHDTWSTGAAPRFPVLSALVKMHSEAPLLSRYLEAVAYGGFDWRRVSMSRLRIWDPTRVVEGQTLRGAMVWDHKYAEIVTHGAMAMLWQIWSAGQRDAGKEVA